MEFNKKLQGLRKQKGITQEALAKALYVSRTAISKWESGRGYPNIDSLKAIASFFDVSVDDLLSGDELPTVAEEHSKQNVAHFPDLIFGSLDLSTALLLFLPLFAQKTDGAIREVSLLTLTAISTYIRVIYFVFTAATCVCGILTLALHSCSNTFWIRIKYKLSLVLSVLGVLLFTLGQQPYGAIFLFAILTIQVFILVKKQ